MRLIDADAIPWIDLNGDNPHSDIKVLITFADKVNKMPTIEERKRGKWIPVTKVYKSSMKMYPFPEVYFEWTDAAEHDEIEGVKCSECDAVYDFTEAQNFCPNCGAQMERSGKRREE